MQPAGLDATPSAGFDQPRKEQLRISGTEGSIQLDDFVIPKAAGRSR